MKKIILISDTHGFIGTDVKSYLDDCDEIWHAGDIGKRHVMDDLKQFDKPMRVVYGNIDSKEIRNEYPKDIHFDCEGVKVFMTHIGGYPGRYVKRVYEILKDRKPDLYICGHSHILKVMVDKKLDIIHMNPGAIGLSGFHKFRTFLRFHCNQGKIENLEAIDLGLRSRIAK